MPVFTYRDNVTQYGCEELNQAGWRGCSTAEAVTVLLRAIGLCILLSEIEHNGTARISTVVLPEYNEICKLYRVHKINV